MNDQYTLFLQKFERKKTTDDCYTPANIYEVVADWVAERYGVDKDTFVRPFWPDSDYTQFDYPNGCVVVDNPPFSILAQIIRDYNAEGIKYFLFADANKTREHACTVCAPANIVYENGADIPTAFVTNLAPELAMEAAPDLCAALREADKKNRAKQRKELPVYEYPYEVLTAARCGYFAVHGTPFQVRRDECVFIRALDAQRKAGKSIFGGGLLLSERAAAERAAAERAVAERAVAIQWPLSEAERYAVKHIGKNKAARKAAKEEVK